MAVLLASDLFEFSWRYQLPALVTLPPAGALGLALLGSLLRRRAAPANSRVRNGTVPGSSPAPAAGERPDPGPGQGQAEPRRAGASPAAAAGALRRAVDQAVDDPVDSRPPRGITRPAMWKSCS